MQSLLQDEFLRTFADGHRATAARITSKMSALRIPPELLAQITNIVQDEIRGLYHGSLVIFDGGSSLADHGSIKIVDSQGIQFISHLHEIGFKFYDGKI